MKVAVVEVLDRDGSARRVVPVGQWPVTVGRAVDCDVVLDDPHVAAHHATIAEADDALSIRVGESVNGVSWPGTHLSAGETTRLPPGQILHVGSTRLRVRRVSEALAAEERLVPEPATSRIPVAVLLLVFFGWMVFEQWLTLNTGSRVTDYLEAVLGMAVVFVLWNGFWALASKIFRHRFEFWPHVRIFVTYLLASGVITAAFPLLSYITGVTLFSKLAGLVSAAVLCAMLVTHVARVLPARRRLAGITIGALYAAGVAVLMTFTYQTQDRLLSEMYVTTLAPPSLRLAPAVPPATFIDEARSLKSTLDAHIGDDDPEEGGMLFNEMSASRAAAPPRVR